MIDDSNPIHEPAGWERKAADHAAIVMFNEVIEKLEADKRRLVEALKPLARHLEWLRANVEPEWWDFVLPETHLVAGALSIADCQRAAALLAEMEEA